MHDLQRRHRSAVFPDTLSSLDHQKLKKAIQYLSPFKQPATAAGTGDVCPHHSATDIAAWLQLTRPRAA